MKYILAILLGLAAVQLSAQDVVETSPVEVETAAVIPADVEATTADVLAQVEALSVEASEVELTGEQRDIVDKFVPTIVQRLFSLIGLMALLAAILPKGSKAGTTVAFLRAILDAFAANWGNAKNR